VIGQAPWGDVGLDRREAVAGREHRQFRVPVRATLAHPDVRDQGVAQALATERVRHLPAFAHEVVHWLARAPVVQRPIGSEVGPAEVSEVAQSRTILVRGVVREGAHELCHLEREAGR